LANALISPSRKPAVDDGEQFSGRIDLRDALAAASFDPQSIGSDLGGGLTLDRLHRGPADELTALFGALSAVATVSDSRCSGVHPGHMHKPFRAGESGGDVDFGNKDRCQDLPDPGQTLDRPITVVLAQLLADPGR
jgi:hypothetical protein